MGETDGPQASAEMKNVGPGPRGASKAKSGRRKPQAVGWRRMPRRQRERLIRMGMWVFLILFVLSVAGGLILTNISRVQVNGPPATQSTLERRLLQ